MSLDERLRDALAGTDPTWESRVPAALTRIRTRHRHQTVVRRLAAGGAVAAAVATAAVVSSQQSADRSVPVPPATLEPSPSPTSGGAVHPLDGTWLSDRVTQGDVRRAAAASGDPSDGPAMLGALPAPPFRIALVVDEEGNSLAVHVRARGVDQVMDEANVEVTSGSLVLHPRFAGGENVHTWSLEDGVLRLAFVSTTEGQSDGVPGEAWQRLLYDTASFTQ